MQYYERLGLTREPFSNSPAPHFLFNARQHITCLQELEIAVRLRRGLNVVLGEVGTGKTTLCRRLIRVLDGHGDVVVHLMLDPQFPSPKAFLRVLCGFFTGQEPEQGLGTWQIKERIKKALLTRGLKEKKLVVLIIDEGQKLERASLELLRELLNYETNASKLLQIVIFAQKELEPVIRSMPNFQDRIDCLHRLSPLGLRESVAMIRYRLRKASPAGGGDLFTWPACLAVHRASRGYPRRMVRLCHKAVLAMLIRRRARIGFGLVRAVLREEAAGRGAERSRLGFTASCLAGLLVLAGGLAFGLWDGLPWHGASAPEPAQVEAAGEVRTPVAPAAPSLALPELNDALAPGEPVRRDDADFRPQRTKGLPRLLGAAGTGAGGGLGGTAGSGRLSLGGAGARHIVAADPEPRG